MFIGYTIGMEHTKEKSWKKTFNKILFKNPN